jgi:hypothetical protein
LKVVLLGAGPEAEARLAQAAARKATALEVAKVDSVTITITGADHTSRARQSIKKAITLTAYDDGNTDETGCDRTCFIGRAAGCFRVLFFHQELGKWVCYSLGLQSDRNFWQLRLLAWVPYATQDTIDMYRHSLSIDSADGALPVGSLTWVGDFFGDKPVVTLDEDEGE